MKFPSNGSVGRSAPRHRARCTIVPIMSVMCTLVGFANILLIVNISRMDAHGGTAHGPSKLVSAPGALPPKQSSTATNNHTSTSWTKSSHLVDCKMLLLELGQEEETGMYMPIHCPSSECTESNFLMNIHNPLMDDVSYAIYKSGCFECDHLMRMLAALKEYPDSYLVDIGGNIGMWSLPAAAAHHETFTIEPFPLNYRRVCKSINKNRLHDKVHLFNVAATSERTTLVIDVPKRNKGGGRVAAATDVSDVEDVNVVEGVPIDSLGLPTDRPIVLKLDVEGHELPALVGALDFLRRANVVYAMTELRPTFQKDEGTYRSWKKVVGILSEKGLQPYRIDYEKETKLDVGKFHEWRHVKHPHVRYFDVVWKKDG